MPLLGHIQWDEPSTMHNYDEDIVPSDTNDANAAGEGEEIEIQYGTGVKKSKLQVPTARLSHIFLL